jgi:hypothetical protein
MGLKINLVNFTLEMNKYPEVMKTTISIDNNLLIKAREFNDKSDDVIIEEALKLFTAVETQKKLKELNGKIQFSTKLNSFTSAQKPPKENFYHQKHQLS